MSVKAAASPQQCEVMHVASGHFIFASPPTPTTAPQTSPPPCRLHQISRPSRQHRHHCRPCTAARSLEHWAKICDGILSVSTQNHCTPTIPPLHVTQPPVGLISPSRTPHARSNSSQPVERIMEYRSILTYNLALSLPRARAVSLSRVREQHTVGDNTATRSSACRRRRRQE